MDAPAQVKGENNDVMVKRLPKKPAPKRFGRKLTAAQKELATHICVDCGWIYAQRWAHVQHTADVVFSHGDEHRRVAASTTDHPWLASQLGEQMMC